MGGVKQRRAAGRHVTGADGLITIPERRGPRKGDQRRAALLAALEGLLETKPLASIAVEEITSRAGVTRPGFYFYFQTTAAAVAALIQQVFVEMTAATSTFFDDIGPSPRQRLRTSLSNGASVWHRHAKLVCALFDAAGADPDIDAVLQGWIDQYVDFTRMRIEQDRKAGRAPSGVPAADLARVLVNMNLRSFERDARAGASAAQIRRTVAALVDVWATALYRDLG